MNFELKYFLELTNCAIHNKDATSITTTTIDWESLLHLARKHNVAAILYKIVSRLPINSRPNELLLEQWKQEAFLHGLLQLAQNQEEKAILDELKSQGIVGVPFKGLLFAQLYPEPLMRVSSDADILVAPEDKDRVVKILEQRGYQLNERETIDTVLVYQKPRLLTVELHISLWEEYIGERVKLLEQLHLTDYETLIQVKACDIEFMTLGYEQHLIYQIYHIIKHFSLSGVGVRHLTDLSLYINQYYDYIDFTSFWNTMRQLNYEVCCSYFFKICVECFEMRKDALNQSTVKGEIAIDSLIEDIIDGGVFGNSSLERYHARNIIKPYLSNQKKVELKKSNMLVGILFPGVATLKDQYPYAKKHTILIPAAWIQRNCYLIRKRFGKTKSSYGEKTLSQAKYRLQLLKELEIINK